MATKVPLRGTEKREVTPSVRCPGACGRWFRYDTCSDSFRGEVTQLVNELYRNRRVILHVCPNDGATIAVTVDDPDFNGSTVYGACDPNLEI